ncbi:LapA family protein [Helicobacter cetorum]|uniref:LapA family protein n=1 Tax=Helicobacter cetorum TaxID=138563 RepID=UPI000CF10180|nr:LapA family protein [Helicobacter cetorum]
MRYYVVFAFLFIVGFGVFIYSIDTHSFVLNIGTTSINLPIAVWLMGVLGAFALFSWIFLFKHNISHKIRLHHEKKDFDKLLNQIMAQDTQKTFLKTKFANKHMENLSQILARYDLKADLNTPNSGCEKVDNLFSHYQNLENGELKESKEHSKHTLSYEHAYFPKRLIALIQHDLKNALETLKNTQIPLELRRYAFCEITQKGSEKEVIKALNLMQGLLDKECVRHLLNAFFEKNIALDVSKISQLCLEAHYDKNDYLKLAQNAQNFLIPDKWFKFFEFLSEEDDQAQKAFLFVLLELEMNDLAKERLATLPFEEYTLLNAYMDLKKEHKAYKLEAFL